MDKSMIGVELLKLEYLQDEMIDMIDDLILQNIDDEHLIRILDCVRGRAGREQKMVKSLIDIYYGDNND